MDNDNCVYGYLNTGLCLV